MIGRAALQKSKEDKEKKPGPPKGRGAPGQFRGNPMGPGFPPMDPMMVGRMMPGGFGGRGGPVVPGMMPMADPRMMGTVIHVTRY